MIDTTVFAFLSRGYIHTETVDKCLTMETHFPFLPEEEKGKENKGEEEDLYNLRRRENSSMLYWGLLVKHTLCRKIDFLV